MKTIATAQSVPRRILHGIVALFCLASAPAAFAAVPIGQVAVKLNGQVIGNKKEILVDSGNKRIEASQLYQYELSGRIRGENGTPAAQLVKKPTSIPAFLESLSPGSSKFLKGSFSNPSGKLPVTVLDKTIRGKRNVPGLGNVKVSLKLLGTIDADGFCQLQITRVKLKASEINDLGTIEYMKGSKLLITAAPTVTLIRTATKVTDKVGSVTIVVKRASNRHGAVRVNYTTVGGTASSADFTSTSGTLTFANGETSKSIVVPILDNPMNNNVRRFTVVLSDPSAGAFLGAMTSTTVVITD